MTTEEQTTAGAAEQTNEAATTTGSLLTAQPLEGKPEADSADQTEEVEQTTEANTKAEPDGTTESEAEESTEEAQGAPETYADFEMPEGTTIGKETSDAFRAAMKASNLSQEQAQKVLAQVAPAIQKDQTERHTAIVKEWVNECVTDPDIGGDKLNASVAIAEKAFNAAASPELKELVKTSGIGNHPDFIKAWKWVGDRLSDDTFVAGSAPGARKHLKGSVMRQPKQVAEIFYGKKGSK